MNGHSDEGIAAYGPGDEMEGMAAILAAHDEEAVDPAWWAMMDDPNALLYQDGHHLAYFPGPAGEQCHEVSEAEWYAILDANQHRIAYQEPYYYSFATEEDSHAN